MTVLESAAARVQAAQAAAQAAQATFEQAVRDEVAAANLSPSDVARALGTKNRQRVYAILGRGADDTAAAMPAQRPVVYLRGNGREDSVWAEVESAMWARGWRTVRARTSAWHLARGGVPVVLCDFSTDLDESTPAPGGGTWFGYNRYAVVGRVRARYAESSETVSVEELLTTSDRVRLTQARAGWLGVPVERVYREMDLPLVTGGRRQLATTVDARALALWVVHALEA